MDCALKLLGNIGGNIVVFQASIPSVGPGALKPREDVKMLGTPAETQLLQQSGSFYKAYAIDCSKAQVAVDLFVFGTQYLDLTTISSACRYTAGSQFYYPQFSASNLEDASKFAQEFHHFLSRPRGIEAVLRVRASKGIRVESFYGNFFARSSDLLALPTVAPENAYGFQLTIDDPITTQFACFQAALLYTTTFGERRIRIINAALPVVTDNADLYRCIDTGCTVALMAKMAAERAVTAKLDDARDAVMNKCIDMLAVYRCVAGIPATSQQLMACESLKLMPLLCLALMRCTALTNSS